jgi:tryptophan synthase beta chain
VPALESSHAVAWALGPGAEETRGNERFVDLICLSGRGDKDLAEALSALGIDG